MLHNIITYHLYYLNVCVCVKMPCDNTWLQIGMDAALKEWILLLRNGRCSNIALSFASGPPYRNKAFDTDSLRT